MADENEVSIVIKAVNDASGVLKSIAKDVKTIADVSQRLEKALGGVTAARKAEADATKASASADINAAKVGKLLAQTETEKARAANMSAESRAKVSKEEERAAAVLMKSQADVARINAQAAVQNQKRLTEEQRTNKAAADEALNRAKKVAEIAAFAAKADAQVAGQQIRNNAMLEKAERDRQRELERTAEALKKKAEAEKKAAAESEKAAAEQNSFLGNIQELVNDFGPATAAIVAFGVAAKQAFDFAEEGANLERLRVTGTALAKSFGVDMVEAVGRLKAASLGTITSQQAMLAANRALLLGVSADTETLSKLMEIAAARGRALGLDTTESFDRIVLGIGRLSTRILDDLGIVVDGESAYAAYGEAIGKTADDLTEAEKRVALTNAIIEDGNKILAATGGLVADNATSFEQLKTNVTELKNAMAETLAGPASDFIDFLNRMVFGQFNASQAIVAQGAALVNNSKSYDEYALGIVNAVDALKELGFSLNAEGDLLLYAGTRAEQVIATNFKLTASEYDLAHSTHELSEADKTAGAAAEQLAKILADKAKALQEARDKVEGLVATTEKLTFEQAGQSAIDASILFGATTKELQAMRVQFGLLDATVIKFNESIKKAAEDGVVSMNEFRDAFGPVARQQIEQLRNELGRSLLDVAEETRRKIADLNQDYQDDLLKDNADLTRDLEDAETNRARSLEDLASESANKREDESQKHKDKLEDIERDYQRDIDKIMRKFELARLRALIDLDARALFEAEQQRDADLKDAKDSAKDKREEEQKDYKNKLEDLDDYQREKREQIEQDYKREREDAQKHYDRQRQDAETALANRRRDIEEDAALRVAQLAQDFEDQKAIIDEQLGIISTTYREAYNERVEDMLDFFDSNQNILLALQNGTVTLDDLRDQFNATGGIPFGGVPFTPDPTTNTPPPPPTNPHNCPTGYEWDPVRMQCVQQPQLIPDNQGFTTPQSGQIVGRVQLEITGDGALASMVRQAAVNTFVDIIAE